MALLGTLIRVSGSPTLTILAASAVLLTAYVVIHTLFIRRIPHNAPPVVSDNLPITGPIGFWTSRWDWFRSKRDASPTGNFTFHAGPNTIVALSGAKSRKLFFESRHLGFAEGYAVLFGSAPKVTAHDDGEGKEDDKENYFHRRFAPMLKYDQFRKRLPTLISDVQEAMDTIRDAPDGLIDPFDSLYRMVYRLTIRLLGPTEMAEDPKMLAESLRMFEMIDGSSTAASIMFPRFPSPAILKRTYGGANLYYMVESIIKKRAASDEKHDDPLQYLQDQGDRTFKIVEFIVGGLFAGLLNSGINAAWVICFLATSPEWLEKTREEVRTVASKYARDKNAPLRFQLDDVPLEAWESEFPVIDLCLRDSMRLNLLGTAMRRNISGRDIPTGNGDEVIPADAFVTYATADVHLDPSIYPDPHKWDPSRYLPERAEDKKETYGWLGWGVARHPCAGMRFAKLENNIITAYFVATFDFHLEDKSGKMLRFAPRVDPNGHSACKPAVRQYVRVSPREK